MSSHKPNKRGRPTQYDFQDLPEVISQGIRAPKLFFETWKNNPAFKQAVHHLLLDFLAKKDTI